LALIIGAVQISSKNIYFSKRFVKIIFLVSGLLSFSTNGSQKQIGSILYSICRVDWQRCGSGRNGSGSKTASEFPEFAIMDILLELICKFIYVYYVFKGEHLGIFS
jgi:hypothetical protein